MCASRRSAQVERNRESAARQYALRERAVELGWPRGVGRGRRRGHRSLGRLDATAGSGFKELVAEVGLGQVGLVLALEVSRLARSSADWHQLLDLCALTGTLIADADGVYSPERLQRPAAARAQGHDVRGRAAPDPRAAGRRVAQQGRARRAAAEPAGRARARRGRPDRALRATSRCATRSSACSCSGAGSGRRARSSGS